MIHKLTSEPGPNPMLFLQFSPPTQAKPKPRFPSNQSQLLRSQMSYLSSLHVWIITGLITSDLWKTTSWITSTIMSPIRAYHWLLAHMIRININSRASIVSATFKGYDCTYEVESCWIWHLRLRLRNGTDLGCAQASYIKRSTQPNFAQCHP